MKSESTNSFDIIDVAETPWYMWDGRVKPGIKVVIKCIDCEEGNTESCNYNGECGRKEELHCDCDPGFFGVHCEHEAPCTNIRCECLIDI